MWESGHVAVGGTCTIRVVLACLFSFFLPFFLPSFLPFFLSFFLSFFALLA